MRLRRLRVMRIRPGSRTPRVLDSPVNGFVVAVKPGEYAKPAIRRQ